MLNVSSFADIPWVGEAMIVIDTHAHFVPERFPARPADVPATEWPELTSLPDGNARMSFDGKEFRIFEPAYWDVEGRVAQMDSEGIAIQVLSPLPELLSYWFSPEAGRAIATHVNESIAAAIDLAPTRLCGLGMLPLQDIEAALAGVAHLSALELRGVIVASNVNGTSIADARFDPVFGALEAADLAVFVHGYRPAGTERLLGSPFLAPVVGVPQDTASAIASLIMTDILGRFPSLRFGFAHGGGTFGAVLARMDHVWHEFPQMQAAVATSPREYARRFYFDSVTFGPEYLSFLVEMLGSKSVIAGTDGPTPIGQRDLAAFVSEACKGDREAAENILWRNAVRFLRLEDLVEPHVAATTN
jgi:aminocarboxymuconate-semialdehyde decarboxylase